MKFRFSHEDTIVIIEFAIIMVATILFIVGVADYLLNSAPYMPIWIWLTFFILAKFWVEFCETEKDRRVNILTDEELKDLPFTLRRQADQENL